MPQRIVEQIGQHTLDPAQVCAHQRQARREVGMQALVARLRGQLELLQHVLQQLRQREDLPLQAYLAMLQPRQLEQRARQPTDLGALRQGDAEVATAHAATTTAYAGHARCWPPARAAAGPAGAAAAIVRPAAAPSARARAQGSPARRARRGAAAPVAAVARRSGRVTQ
ncbi:hypothetical protein G6F63_014377 [Rhizopus arrhizus]|nr:hypothetical protein G6F63_014377 [Rhizopus arrhizus]